MHNYMYQSWGHGGPGLGGPMLGFGPVIVIAVLWTLFWKGWSMWLAARRGEKPWFIALLILNTLGILDIVYIFLIAKKSDKPIVTTKKEEHHDHSHPSHHEHTHTETSDKA